jgi:hypothetical protein
LSVPFLINDGGDAVGFSLDGTFTVSSAVLWEKGASAPVNLNDLVIDNAGLYLQIAEDINSRGEIVGFGQQNSTGETRGFLAIPINSGAVGERTSVADRSIGRPTLSETGLKLLQRRLRSGPLGARRPGPR